MVCVLAGCLDESDSTKAGGSGPPVTLTIGTQDFPGTRLPA
jgi:hypothetical protein